MKIFLGKRTSKKVILSILFIVCAVVLLSQMNSYHMIPFSSVTPDSPRLVTGDGKTTVISDASGTRLYFLGDDDKKVKSIVDIASSDDKAMQEVFSMTVADGSLYLSGVRYCSDSLSINEEIVSEYTLDGRFKKNIYTRNYAGNRPTSPRFLKLYEKDGRLRLIETSRNTLYMADLSGGTFKVSDSVLTPRETCKCIIAGDELLLRDVSFGYGRWDLKAGKYAPSGDSEFVDALCSYYDLTKDEFLKLFKRTESRHAYDVCGVQGKSGEFEKIYAASSLGGCVYSCSKETGTYSALTDIAVSSSITISSLLFWLSVLVMMFFAVLFLIRIFKALRNVDFVRVPVLILCVSLVICGFYTWHISDIMISETDTALQSQNSYVRSLITKDCPEILNIETNAKFSEFISDSDNEESLTALINDIDVYYEALGRHTMYGTTIGLVHGNGISTLYESNAKSSTGMTPYLVSDYMDYNENGEYITSQSDTYDIVTTMSSSNRTVTVSISSYCNLDLLIQKILDRSITILISMIILFALIYIAFRLGRMFIDDYKYRRRLKSPTRSDQIVSRLPLAAFIANTAETAQSIIWLFAAKELYGKISDNVSDSAVSVVLIAINAGIFIGMSGGSIIKKRLPENKVGMAGLALSVISYAVTVTALLAGSFWLFVFGNFMTGIAMYGFICRAFMNTIAFTVDTREESSWLIKRVQRSYLASTVIGITIGGFISQYLGYSILYGLCGLLVIVLAFIMIPMFSHKKGNDLLDISAKSDSFAKSGKNALGLLRRPVFITFVLCSLLPFALLSQYSSYQYPVYASNAGLTPILLSNISVITQAIIFVFFDFIMKRFKWCGPRAALIRLIFVSGLFLFGFFICPNYWWAIISLFVIQYMTRPYNAQAPEYVARMAAREGFNVPDSQSLYQTLLMCTTLLSILILSSLMLIGANAANVITGAGIVILTIVFMIITTVDKKKRKAAKYAKSEKTSY